MIYFIRYRKETLFDIEFYLQKDETIKDENNWNSELHCQPLVRGISRFLQEKLKDESFNIDEFIKDSEEIQEIRGWLWEKHDNNLLDGKSAKKRHDVEFDPELKEIINTYSKKYGFSITTD